MKITQDYSKADTRTACRVAYGLVFLMAITTTGFMVARAALQKTLSQSFSTAVASMYMAQPMTSEQIQEFQQAKRDGHPWLETTPGVYGNPHNFHGRLCMPSADNADFVAPDGGRWHRGFDGNWQCTETDPR